MRHYDNGSPRAAVGHRPAKDLHQVVNNALKLSPVILELLNLTFA